MDLESVIKSDVHHVVEWKMKPVMITNAEWYMVSDYMMLEPVVSGSKSECIAYLKKLGWELWGYEPFSLVINLDMYLKFNPEEISWIGPEFLTKEVAMDICGFWLDTDADKLCTARYQPDGSIAHYWFNQDSNQWEFLKIPLY